MDSSRVPLPRTSALRSNPSTAGSRASLLRALRKLPTFSAVVPQGGSGRGLIGGLPRGLGVGRCLPGSPILGDLFRLVTLSSSIERFRFADVWDRGREFPLEPDSLITSCELSSGLTVGGIFVAFPFRTFTLAGRVARIRRFKK